MENKPLSDLMEKTITKIREMVDANTVIGDPIVTQDGVTLIPVSKISMGFGTGGTEYATKAQKPDAQNAFGGGGGAGLRISPVAFLVIHQGNVRVISLDSKNSSPLNSVLDSAPELLDKVKSMISKKKEPAEE